MTNEIRRVCEAAGFGAFNTGGGCMAWHRQAADGRFVWITDADGTGLGNDPCETFLVGVYDADMEPIGDCVEADGLTAAIARALAGIAS